MASSPITLEHLAITTNLSLGTVKFYLHKYSCFKLVDYGKGYVYEKPRTRDPGERVNENREPI